VGITVKEKKKAGAKVSAQSKAKAEAGERLTWTRVLLKGAKETLTLTREFTKLST
jgi:hypothetical protein